MIELLGDSPDEPSGEALIRYFREDEVSLYVGSLLFFLGSLSFLWWSAALREVVTVIERGSWLGSVLFGSAVAFIVCLFGVLAPQIGGGFLANEADVEIDPGAAQALWSAGDGFFSAAAYSAASFLAATTVAAWRTRLLARWFLVVTALVAILLAIPLIHWIGLVFAFPLWLIAAGVLLRAAADAPQSPSSERRAELDESAAL